VSHTPGPWEIVDGEVYAASAHRYIAEHRGIDGVNVTEEQREANLRLIAAAPDLLAVVRDLVTAAEATTDESPGGFIEALSELGPRARGALDKALGELGPS